MLADDQCLARPVSYGACRYAADQEVRAEPADVGAELGDSPVGGDEQVEDVEALRPGIGNQLGVRSGRGLHHLGGNRGVPWVTGHPWDTARSGGGGDREQPVPRSPGHRSTAAADMDGPVTGDTTGGQPGRVERLAGQ